MSKRPRKQIVEDTLQTFSLKDLGLRSYSYSVEEPSRDGRRINRQMFPAGPPSLPRVPVQKRPRISDYGSTLRAAFDSSWLNLDDVDENDLTSIPDNSDERKAAAKRYLTSVCFKVIRR